MRIRRLLLRVVAYYVVASVTLSIALGELPFHTYQIPVTEQQSAQAMASRFGAALEDASLSASDMARLRGWVLRPADANGNAVILLHGVGDNRQGMMGFAELFLSHGYAVLLPDSRAQGESGGKFPTYGLREANDVRKWFDWINARYHPKCVFGMGESMGAAIVLQAVKTTPFCAVVAESTFASFQEIAYIRVGQVFHTGSWLGRFVLRPSIELAFLYGKVTRGVNLASASPEQSVAATQVPILLIHGSADHNIPPHQSEMVRDRNPARVVLWEVPRAGHCGAVNAAYDEFNNRVLGWFTSHDYNAAHVAYRGNWR